MRHPGSPARAWGADFPPAEFSEEVPSDPRSRPLVSIVVAIHNVEKYLPQCLDALVHQTLKDIEIIAVDDASTDNSPQILDEYSSRYSQIRVITCPVNVGLASVRNIGMRAARGEYIAFADGDDWVDTRMCEVMHRKISADGSEVLLANTQVFYDDLKIFGQFFDQHVRQALDPQLRTRPFELSDDTRVLLLEPVAWTKLYDRSFLEDHELEFEAGLSSFEDMCFHFAVLSKAKRMSLIDEPLMYYRQNRPGQISGMTSRKVFEVFPIFDRIHQILVESKASAEVWGRGVRIFLRQFDWLLSTRVRHRDKREFLDGVAGRLARIPERGFHEFAREARPFELAKLFCLRRKRLRAYQRLTQRRWPLVPLAHVLYRYRHRGFLKLGRQQVSRGLRLRLARVFGGLGSTLVNATGLERRFQAIQHEVGQLAAVRSAASDCDEELAATCRLGAHELLFSSPSRDGGLSDALWRMDQDYYLTQTAVFREGDVAVDVGAHVGVVSVFLAKQHPYIRVFAIEPDPVRYRCLRRNIELNGLSNVIPVNKAVSGNGRPMTLYSDPFDSGWGTTDRRLAGSLRLLRPVETETVTLDQLFEEHDLQRCRLLKITAPGAVREVLDSLSGSERVDLLCGEAMLDDCSRARLEMASWRVARQFFWRTVSRMGEDAVHSWAHQMPHAIESESSVSGTRGKRRAGSSGKS
jgi:glycosyltransferase EpsH